jgi:hypothetical protein
VRVPGVYSREEWSLVSSWVGLRGLMCVEQDAGVADDDLVQFRAVAGVQEGEQLVVGAHRHGGRINAS